MQPKGRPSGKHRAPRGRAGACARRGGAPARLKKLRKRRPASASSASCRKQRPAPTNSAPRPPTALHVHQRCSRSRKAAPIAPSVHNRHPAPGKPYKRRPHDRQPRPAPGKPRRQHPAPAGSAPRPQAAPPRPPTAPHARKQRPHAHQQLSTSANDVPAPGKPRRQRPAFTIGTPRRESRTNSDLRPPTALHVRQ